MTYLISVTVAWTLFLLFFEIFYKNNLNFTANRIYLLLSIAIGLLLPIIPLPSNAPVNINAVQKFYAAAQSTQMTTTTIVQAQQSATPAAMSLINTQTNTWNITLILLIIYGTGVLLLLIKCLVELTRIASLIRRNPAQILFDHKVITTGKIHSPYSFISYIFLTDTTSLNAKELEYIIQHEAAHNDRKHWIDLWLFQLACIIFWFHPLIWRYRYLLQLQHEYEADATAANKDPYTYGQFLLQQTLLSGVPSITHSFHFSPIKNRINMLTKKHSFKPGNWKYLLLTPALLACTFLMAKTAPKVETALQGNQKTFKGNTFIWRESDTLFYDKKYKQAELVPANAKVKPQVITSINNEPVYQNDYLQTPSKYSNADTAFATYVIKEFKALRKNTSDSNTYIVDLDLVIDKEGKIVYYDVRYASALKSQEQRALMATFYNQDITANMLVDKILAQSHRWKPAMSDNKPVNSFITVRLPGC